MKIEVFKKMKTTIKKMIRFGLRKEDIKAEFGLNEEQFKRYEAQGRGIEVSNLPELLDKYNSSKVINNDDRIKAELFDKLFRIEEKEIPNLTIEQKSEMLAAFPRYIEEIKVKIAEEEIQKLEEQISTIKEQINKICLENNIAVKYPTTLKDREELETLGETLDGTKYNAFGEVIQEEKHDKQAISLSYGEGIRIQSPNYKLGEETGMYSIKKSILKNLEAGDEITINSPFANYTYFIERKVVTNKASYAKLKLKQD